MIDAVGAIRVRPNGGAPAGTPVAQAQMWRSGDEFREKVSTNTSKRTKEKRQTHVDIWVLLKKTYVDVRAGEERKPTRLYISSPKSASTRVWVEFRRSRPFNAIPHTCVCAVVTGHLI